MKRTLLILASTIFAVSMFAFYFANQVPAVSEQKKGGGDSVQDLNDRVGKLEAQVAALQAQIKDLTLKASSKFITIPRTQAFPGNMPRGAIEREFNGMKYWIIPINEGH